MAGRRSSGIRTERGRNQEALRRRLPKKIIEEMMVISLISRHESKQR
jgi:hypothetical protein